MTADDGHDFSRREVAPQIGLVGDCMSRDARPYVLWRPTVTRVRVKYDTRKEVPGMSYRGVHSKGNIEEGTPASSKFPASITLRLPFGNRIVVEAWWLSASRLDITGQLPRIHAPVLEEHVKESREKRAELRRAMSIRALPGCAGAMIKGVGNGVQKETAEEIAIEEEKLKNDSAEDVRRQLEQQHVAESEEKAVQGIKRAADKLLSHTGEAIVAKLAPVLSVAEHTTESVVSDGAAGVEDLQEERAVHEYLALAADGHERSLPLSIYTKHNLLGILPNENEQREGEGRSAPIYMLYLAPSLWHTRTDGTAGERKTCDYKRSTIPNHASPAHSIKIKRKTYIRAIEFLSIRYHVRASAYLVV
ncbi:hypothetical protein EDD15DRAFT_2405407 [Pisolithus albus]|nr:hypothetical protein EDD15DRAFT_2405407 [Pisolithus albus]